MCLYVSTLYICCIIRMELRFSPEDIFIQDDLILMKASVTHEANLCNLLCILWLEAENGSQQACNVQVRRSSEKK